MSRTIVENEARTNQDSSVVEDINNYLEQSPPAAGYEIFLEIRERSGPCFEAVIRAESPKVIHAFLSFNLEEVPTIKEYFRSTGALQLAWEGFLKHQKCDAKLAHEILFDKPQITQQVDFTIERAKK